MIHFAKSGQFLATVHLCTFSVLLFLLLFWGSMTQMLDLFSQSYRPMRLCSFSSAIYFLLMFRAGNFYCSFSSLIIFLVLSILLLNPSSELLFQLNFQFCIFHLLSAETFFFSHLCQCCCKKGKTISRRPPSSSCYNCNVSDISRLAAVGYLFFFKVRVSLFLLVQAGVPAASAPPPHESLAGRHRAVPSLPLESHPWRSLSRC